MDHFCLICRGTDIEPIYKHLLRCRQCDYRFADLQLSDEDLEELYSRSLFREGKFVDYAADQKYLLKNFELRLKVLRRFLQKDRHKRLLEIGSAYGFFLNAAKDDFSEVLGIDITDEGVQHTREQLKLRAIQADFLKHDFGDERFDVVCLWDTIEHLRRPDLYIDKIASLTEPGALLAITTGDIQSVVARWRGRKWRMIIPPVHAHYFSKGTLTRLLKDRGFEVIHNRYCGFYRSATNVAYIILTQHRNQRKLFNGLQRAGVLNWGFYLNVYDIMYVIARRV
ncbi:MAG TPA: class I SAM-dependent methyltransferase [Pyrinomonadaceae bacterium]|nr:class I SAM-dependent methyltransferase [Pyrinomonadaceae bacterium]